MINIEVVYATPKKQILLALQVNDNCTAKHAVEQSGMLQQFPEIDLATMTLGIFSKHVPLSHRLREGDRVEIYRPLLIDPKQARLLRAQRKAKG